MKYKGDYNSGSSYDKGDVTVYTDGVAYVAIDAAPAGVTPHEERFWERVKQPIQEIVLMFKDYLDGIQAAIPDNISNEAITLSTETADYLITVDDSGDTPELDVTAIEEEGDDT